MKLSRYIIAPAVAALGTLASCSEEKLGPTIFPDVEETVDPNSYTYKFDTWLNQNFRDVYNLNMMYKMKDVEADMNYNLVPARLDRAIDLSLLTKYLWFDAYGELVGQEFLQTYGPRIIHLIGSPAYNPTAGTEILGLAEGGLKVSLFKVNEMVLDDINQLNEYYFRTMHHEFGHILHQTKSYPTEFNLLSSGLYDNGTWQNKNGGMVASMGFITPYASSENREDFAETIANYITRTDEQLAMLMWCAEKGWTTGKDKDEEDDDDNDPYYCYYYFASNDDRSNQKRTYFMNFADRPVISNATDYRIGVMDGNKFFPSVEEAEAYLAEREAALKNTQRDYESRKAFGKPYAALSDSEKRSVDSTVDALTYIFAVPDEDGIDGKAIILQKQNIVRNWFKDTWKLDFDKLRTIVQHRQQTKDEGLAKFHAEVDAIK